MGLLNRAKEETALLWTGSRAIPNLTVIGSGTGTFNSARSGLYADLNLPRAFTSIGSNIAQEITWTSDWGATSLSGLSIKEFGLSVGSSGNGIWNHEILTSPIVCDGTIELQLQITYQTF